MNILSKSLPALITPFQIRSDISDAYSTTTRLKRFYKLNFAQTIEKHKVGLTTFVQV